MKPTQNQNNRSRSGIDVPEIRRLRSFNSSGVRSFNSFRHSFDVKGFTASCSLAPFRTALWLSLSVGLQAEKRREKARGHHSSRRVISGIPEDQKTVRAQRFMMHPNT